MGDSTTALTAIVEFSIGMAGFSGVVAIFVSTKSGWDALRKFRAGNLIVISFMSGFSALCSLVLSNYFQGPILWQASCGVLVVLSVLLVLYAAPRSQKAFAQSIFSIGQPVNTTIWILTFVNLIFQFAGALGLTGYATYGIFATGLIFNLAVAALNFYRLVFQPFGDQEDFDT